MPLPGFELAGHVTQGRGIPPDGEAPPCAPGPAVPPRDPFATDVDARTPVDEAQLDLDRFGARGHLERHGEIRALGAQFGRECQTMDLLGHCAIVPMWPG